MSEIKEAPKAKDPEWSRTDEGGRARESSAPLMATAAHSHSCADSPRRWTGSSRTSALERGCTSRRLLSRGHELLRREAGLVPAEWSPRIDVLRARGTVRGPRRPAGAEQGGRQGRGR